MPHLELIDDEYIGVSFQYDRGVVQRLRKLNARRWNPEKRRWEVHIVHLADIMKIFHLRPEDVPPDIVRLYQSQWIKAKAVVRVGNSFTQIEGGQLPMDRIDEATSFLVYGHYYNLQYLDGKWDGKKHLFDRRNFTFPTGLLDRVLAALKQEGVGFELEDRRESSGEGPLSPGSLDNLVPHVREAIPKVLEAKRGLLELAPGAAKWDLMARLIRTLNRDLVFLTSGRAALERAVRELSARLDLSVGQAGGGRVRLESLLVVSTPVACSVFGIRLGKPHAGEDTIEDELDLKRHRRDLEVRVREAPVVLFDEVHTVPADTCYQLVMRCSSAEWRLGFSASPYRADGHDLLLEAAFGPFIHHTDISTLIRAKLAVPARVIFVHPNTYPPCERDREPEEIFERAILKNEERHALVAKRAEALVREERKVVVLAYDRDHAEAILAHLSRGELIEGTGEESERARAARRIADKKESILFVTSPSGEYLIDEPGVTGLVLAAPTASEIKALERICRALAPDKGKKDVLVLDFFDSVPYLKEKSVRRLEFLRSQKALHVEDEGMG